MRAFANCPACGTVVPAGVEVAPHACRGGRLEKLPPSDIVEGDLSPDLAAALETFTRRVN